MRRQGRRIPGRIAGLRRRLALAALAALGGTGTLALAGSGTPPATLDQAAAAQARPNIVVIETDDQTLESMRVMDNVNSLIGDRGARFTRSFVNYSLCCPSRATFLTGQYMHNHGVFGNKPPNGGFGRFQALHGNNNLAVWLRRAGYYTAMIGKYLNGYAEPTPGAAGLDRVARGGPGHAGGLRLHAERERHPRPLRHRSRRLQAGRADPQGRGPCQPPGAGGAAVLPLAHLHGPPLRRSGAEPEPALSTARASRSRRPATPTRSTPSRCRGRRTSTRPTSPTSRPRSASRPRLNAE